MTPPKTPPVSTLLQSFLTLNLNTEGFCLHELFIDHILHRRHGAAQLLVRD